MRAAISAVKKGRQDDLGRILGRPRRPHADASNAVRTHSGRNKLRTTLCRVGAWTYSSEAGERRPSGS